MVDALGELGEPVLDRTLVLQVLRGLNDKFSHMAALTKRTRPFPLFHDVRADLNIEKVTMTSKAAAPSALVATVLATPTAPRPPASAPEPLSTPPAAPLPGSTPRPPGGNPNNRHQRWRPNGNEGGNSGPNRPSGPATPWGYNPFTSMFVVWPGQPPPACLSSGLVSPFPFGAPAPPITPPPQ